MQLTLPTHTTAFTLRSVGVEMSCRISEFDIALAGRSLLEEAKEMGFKLRSGGVRTGPLSLDELRKLGLLELVQRLSELAGRDVAVMISVLILTAGSNPTRSSLIRVTPRV